MSSRVNFRLIALTAVLIPILVSIGLYGCGSPQSMFRPYDGTRTLPTTQRIPNPDSLRYVTVVTRPDSVAIVLDRSFSSLTQDWSSQVQPNPLFRPSPFNTFATLQSREFTLASLERNQDISSLTTDQAEKRIDETIAAYDTTISFQIQLFLDAERISMPLSTLRKSVVATLRVDAQETYSSIRTEQANVTFMNRGGGGVYHYPITVHFERHAGGEDLLLQSDRLELYLRPFSSTAELSFEWRRKRENATHN